MYKIEGLADREHETEHQRFEMGTGRLFGQYHSNAWLAHQFVIVSMAADPELQNVLRSAHTQRAVIEASADRPKAPDFFQMQRWVVRINL